MSNQILIDASYLYALYNPRDKHHVAAIALAQQIEQSPLIPEIILPEITYLFERDLNYSAAVKFLAEFAETEAQLVCLTIADIQRAQAIMTMYASAEFDLADACIMALSERLQITQVCTFDRRDFSIFRPAHCTHLELMP